MKDPTKSILKELTLGGVHHLAIMVRDLERAERFYIHTLGLEVVRRWTMPDGKTPRSLWIDLGPNFLAVELGDPPHPTAT